MVCFQNCVLCNSVRVGFYENFVCVSQNCVLCSFLAHYGYMIEGRRTTYYATTSTSWVVLGYGNA